MKKFIKKNILNYIKSNSNYSEEKLKEIEYGLISIYLTISKLIVIIILSLFLHITKEVIIFLILFNILRLFAFGLHATKSWICLLSSTLVFIGIPILNQHIIFNNYIKVILIILNLFLIIKNSPADTIKRPIVSKKRRSFLKTISTLILIIYSILCFTIKDNYIINCLIFSSILENILISPTTYKMFKLPYNNYLNFLERHPEYIN